MLTPEELQGQLDSFPRLHYGRYPTPLEPLDNLTLLLGGPQLWLKRDDGIGPGLGGNKGRKLEFLMAEILEQGRRKVVTYGGLQSNHARMTAAACAACGLQAHLFFFAPQPPALAGNLLLDQFFGAQLHFVPYGGGNSAGLTLEMTNRLVRLLAVLVAGPGAYFMPVGGHNRTGCLGYVNAACELQQQAQEMGLPLDRTTLVMAAGTGGTLAGLLAGFRLLSSPMHILGLDIGKLWKKFPSSLAHVASALCHKLNQPTTFTAGDVPLVEGTYAGPGYANFTLEVAQAIQLLARTEGVLLDPVYTGKAFAGLLDLIQKGRFARDEHVIFLHSGGLPGLWAYEEALNGCLAG